MNTEITKPCHIWRRQGKCWRGASCKFSHSFEHNTEGCDADGRKVFYPTGTARMPAQASRNTGTVIATISLSSLEPYDANNFITITGFKYVTSYNISNGKPTTIMVPGSPPKWSPPALPTTLQSNIGSKLTDKEAYQAQVSTNSLFAALSVSIAHTDTRTLPSTDLIIDRNVLRKLLDFVGGKVDQSWELNVQMVRNTMVFEKNEQGVARYSSQGYGIPFERAFLKYEDDSLKGTSGHYRMATYEIGGMQWMVRFEVDGYYDVRSTKDITGSFQSLDLGQARHGLQSLNTNPNVNESSYQGIRIVKSEIEMCILPMIEVKTAKVGKSPTRAKWMPQLYFSQVKHLIIANHNDGVFEKSYITESDKSEDMREWEVANQEKLQKLLQLIRAVKNTVNKTKGRKATVLCKKSEKKDEILILEQKTKGLKLGEGVTEQLWGPPATNVIQSF
ncbi:0cf884ff-87e1-46aa-b8b0-1f0a495ac970 [Sclerotinia trifoliorum]|uniref:0cf884ff-87e1-46aa-b8b0-1f0a495ac970 n=1 Tax=Sclerotinia trifoliorum TaxID=28548 RepID=A0A8H2VY50_9HELO|nr:0cf884ff-87e1-46aa-b8b0-1f0a495ac970 [Sclerotinia trifoliorum]